jgi:hypothetical protein
VCALTVLAVVAGAAGSAPAPQSGVIEYEEQMTIQTQPVRKVRRKIRFKGERFRTEWNTPEGKQILIGGPDGMFQIGPGSSEAAQFPFPPRSARVTSRPLIGIPGLAYSDIAMIRERWKRVGSERVGRYLTDIYEPRYSSMLGMPKARKFASRVWISPDLPVAVKSVTKAPECESVMLLTLAQFDVPVSDSLLQLPKGMRVRPMAPGSFTRTLAESRARAQTTAALSHLKQLALGVSMYIQDYGGKLPPMRDAVSLKNALTPYVKNPGAFQSPGTGRPFQPVPRLGGGNMAGIKDPSQIVMLYSAVPEPGGDWIVAFVNGQVRRLAPEQWGRLAQQQKLPR